MKIKRIKSIKVNSYTFSIKWNKEHAGGSFSYNDREIEIGTAHDDASVMFMILTHELFEIVALEMNVRYARPDIQGDYLFAYDHRQHETMANMLAGLLAQFII